MRIFTSAIVLTFSISLLLSCDKKGTLEINELSVENRILDQASLLTSEQENSVFQIIKELEENIGSQIAILTIDTLHGEPIDEFSLRTANEIKLGREKYNDGVLLTIAVKNREMRIEVGSGLEKIIQNEMASQIIREDIAPAFAEGDYFDGITKGVEKIKSLIENQKDLVGQTTSH